MTFAQRAKKNSLVLAELPVDLLPDPNKYRKWQRLLMVIGILPLVLGGSLLGSIVYTTASFIRYWEIAVGKND
jgi:hypothetical protein